MSCFMLKNGESDQKNTTITNCSQTLDIVKKSHTTITRPQEDKQSKVTTSLFPIKVIVKLELT